MSAKHEKLPTSPGCAHPASGSDRRAGGEERGGVHGVCREASGDSQRGHAHRPARRMCAGAELLLRGSYTADRPFAPRAAHGPARFFPALSRPQREVPGPPHRHAPHVAFPLHPGPQTPRPRPARTHRTRYPGHWGGIGGGGVLSPVQYLLYDGSEDQFKET